MDAWHSAKVDLEKAKHGLKEDARRRVLECKAKTHPSPEEREKLSKEAKESRAAHEAVMRGELPGVEPEPPRAQNHPTGDGAAAGVDQFEEAIQMSVAATSRGDPEEDKNIERAIRASVAELVAARGAEVGEPEALDRAVSASVLEATRFRGDDEHTKGPPSVGQGPSTAAKGQDDSLKHSLQRSLEQRHHDTNGGSDRALDGAADGTHGQHVPQALLESRDHARTAAGQGVGLAPADDPELRRAIEESRQSHQRHEHEAGRAKMEEDIVLEYIKRQSLAEQEHRSAMDARSGTGP